eukprot:9484231-Pyramimonas_sp.AAC.1
MAAACAHRLGPRVPPNIEKQTTPQTERFGAPLGFLGSALAPPPWSAELARGGAGGRRGPSADRRNTRGAPK